MALVYQINVKPQTEGERGLPKNPVNFCAVCFNGLEGDYNTYRTDKKKPGQAVLILPLETITEISANGFPVKPGDLGENITTRGISYSSFSTGRVYRAGEVHLMITKPATPCVNLKLLPYVGEQKVAEFMRALKGRRGWYANVLREGVINQGDVFEEIEF